MMKLKKKGFVGLVERTDILPLIMAIVFMALSLFMFFYGYRLDPYDGITWDDYDRGGKPLLTAPMPEIAVSPYVQ